MSEGYFPKTGIYVTFWSLFGSFLCTFLVTFRLFSDIRPDSMGILDGELMKEKCEKGVFSTFSANPPV